MSKIDISKIPELKSIMPNNENDKKCSPQLDFENGSCIPLDMLIEMANAYNNYIKKNNDSHKGLPEIVLDNVMSTKKPVQYKIYLLSKFNEISKGSQRDWIKQKFINYMSPESKEKLVNNTFRPPGPQGQFEWLSTIDINLVLSQYEEKYKDFLFLGAVPIDFEELDYLPFKKMNFDELQEDNKKRFGIIFNLDEHHKSGSHWISLFFDLDNGQIYFSDSYGIEPERRILSFMEKIKKYLESKNKVVDMRHNETQHQKGGSECGVYSINFILRLLKGKTFDHITRKRLKDNKVNKCRNVYFDLSKK